MVCDGRRLRLRREKQLDGHQRRAYRYSHVGYVEDRPLIGFDVQEDEIYDAPHTNAVNEVAADSCRKQSERP